MSKIQLFLDKKNCCACGACFNICPKHAILFQNDEYGFSYPYINEELCIKCGLCKKVCHYQNNVIESKPERVYVALTNNTNPMDSTSGGIFASLAKSFLENKGSVYGAAMEYIEKRLVVHHIRIQRERELYKLLGSKYVQSDMGNVFKLIKKEVNDGKQVLFCGTPCQVDGLRGYLGKEYSNLLLIDLICHGVPSQKFFQDYIINTEKRKKIVEFKFRDKGSGWGLTGKKVFKDGKTQKVYKNESSYYEYFLKGYTYRENCYSCKYASSHRPGDITIGDFWGIEKEHPELMKINGGILDKAKGISCLIVNTDIGKSYLEKYQQGLNLWESEFSKIAKNNQQLTIPSQLNEPKRKKILEEYRIGGYQAVEKEFRKEKGYKLYLIKCKNRLRNLKGVRTFF